MQLTILGNNSALPAHDRHPTAQIISTERESILIDCGEGTQIQIQRYKIKWSRISAIFISHLHGDHYFGVPGLLNSMSLLSRTAPLKLFAPLPLKAILEGIFQSAGTVLNYPFEFIPLPDEPSLLYESEELKVSSFPVEHRIVCDGFLVENKERPGSINHEKCSALGIPVTSYESIKRGNDYKDQNGKIISSEGLVGPVKPAIRYAYCADTLYTESFLPYIKNADALYHESTFLDEDKEKAGLRFHSTATQAATIAKLAGAKHLYLGHFSSKYRDTEAFETEAKTIFNNTTVTVEGVVYDLGI